MSRRYSGWFGSKARRRCPHSNLGGIYGDEIRAVGYWRLFCGDCGRYLDGPVGLVTLRQRERPPVTEGGTHIANPTLPTYE